MANQSDAPGGRLPLFDPQSLTPEQRALRDRLSRTLIPWADSSGFASKTADGRLIGPFNPMLLNPGVSAGLLDLLKAEGEHTTLSPRVREVVILTVGSVWGSAYELYAHEAVARKAGISAEAVRALVEGRPADDLSDEEQVAQRYTRRMSAEHRVPPDLYEAAEAAFGPQGLADIAALAGCYHLISFLLNGFEIPAPAPRP